MVGLENGHIRKKISPKMVNPRDIAGERRRRRRSKVWVCVICRVPLANQLACGLTIPSAACLAWQKLLTLDNACKLFQPIFFLHLAVLIGTIEATILYHSQ